MAVYWTDTAFLHESWRSLDDLAICFWTSAAFEEVAACKIFVQHRSHGAGYIKRHEETTSPTIYPCLMFPRTKKFVTMHAYNDV